MKSFFENFSDNCSKINYSYEMAINLKTNKNIKNNLIILEWTRCDSYYLCFIEIGSYFWRFYILGSYFWCFSSSFLIYPKF